MSRDANYIRLINCKRWRDLRIKKLKADPLCEYCKENDIITLATEIHHVIPVESATRLDAMSSLMYRFDNLMSLCNECHNKIHEEMFNHTKANAQQSNERKTQRFIDIYL